MKIILVLAILGLFLVSAFVALAAQNDSDNNTGLALGQQNRTYLQCVSDAAKVKNDCYEASKTTALTCAENADKEAAKLCKTSGTENKNQCKTEFKAKKSECKQIKHNFMDSIRAMFY